MNKVVRDGQVAVLYSPGYGAGWYTWNRERTDDADLLFDPGLVDLILEGKGEEALAYATLKWPDAYLGGLDQLQVAWVPKKKRFRIHEYDGNESVVLLDDEDYFVA